MGEVGILNVGAGDNKLVFDPTDQAGMIRAARIVKDMIRRGYALLVEVGKTEDGKPKFQRATDFDETKCEYIIADFDGDAAREQDREEARHGEKADTPTPRATGGRGKTHRVGASQAKAISVGRTAGG